MNSFNIENERDKNRNSIITTFGYLNGNMAMKLKTFRIFYQSIK